MGLAGRYSFAFLGGFLAMSAHVYWLFGRGEWVSPQRVSNTIASALIFAHLFAPMVLIARDLQIKQNTLRFIICLIGGVSLGTMAWFAHVFLFLFQTQPDFLTLIMGGFALAFGFFIIGILSNLNRLSRFIVGVITFIILLFGVIYTTHQNYLADSSAQALLYFQADNPNDVYLIGLPFALTLAVIPNLPILFSSSFHGEKKSHPLPDHE